MAARILVVDDEPNLLRVVEYSLTAAGFEVVLAQNGNEALAMVKNERPDLVILDVMLPELSGIEACKLLRSRSATADLPIIMLSARAQVADMVTGLESGADEYVTKPVDLQEMVARVRALLSRTERLRGTAAPLNAKVVGFVGAKGGVGTTTVALSVASIFASRRKRAAAIELRPYLGTFAQQLQQTPPRGVHSLLALDPARIGSRELSPLLYEAASGLKVLFGPHEVGDFGAISREHATAIVKGLGSMFDYVVIDLPCQPSEASEAALQCCETVVLVVEPDYGCVGIGRLTLDVLYSWGVSRGVVRAVVVNRAALPVTPTLAGIKSELGCDVIASVPVAPAACAKSLELGTPIALYQPESAVAIALVDVAQALL